MKKTYSEYWKLWSVSISGHQWEYNKILAEHKKLYNVSGVTANQSGLSFSYREI